MALKMETGVTPSQTKWLALRASGLRASCVGSGRSGSLERELGSASAGAMDDEARESFGGHSRPSAPVCNAEQVWFHARQVPQEN